ncbi:arylesterase [Pedobacter hartonius]|uniref:Acyl-CoA thioesterase-1 n=1 Tax=Pedobacter hartonius TaxID=425514 RepID=A0A1H4B293_9SPHI|nr:arylesterase [Pedobacter hartonius]SEA42196.1 acyl-CoA thioesterase-1 [Pedobacter hartonius]
MRSIKLLFYYIAFTLFAAVISGCSNNEKAASDKKTADTTATTANTAAKKSTAKNILFFGTSLTAGLGVDPDQAFPALIQHRVDSLHLPYKIINAGLSGETSADGKSRIDWLLRQAVDVFVLELGANDGLRGIPVKETEVNLQAIIDKVKKKYPDAKLVLAGMQMPPSMGEKYTVPFRELFPALAKKNQMAFIPFLLKGVGGVPKLIQEDGLHPTQQGHKILAQNVWEVLQPQL